MRLYHVHGVADCSNVNLVAHSKGQWKQLIGQVGVMKAKSEVIQQIWFHLLLFKLTISHASLKPLNKHFLFWQITEFFLKIWSLKWRFKMRITTGWWNLDEPDWMIFYSTEYVCSWCKIVLSWSLIFVPHTTSRLPTHHTWRFYWLNFLIFSQHLLMHHHNYNAMRS